LLQKDEYKNLLHLKPKEKDLSPAKNKPQMHEKMMNLDELTYGSFKDIRLSD